MAARNAGHAPQTCAHVQLAVERRSRGRKGEIPQRRHPGVALSQTRGRRGAERFGPGRAPCDRARIPRRPQSVGMAVFTAAGIVRQSGSERGDVPSSRHAEALSRASLSGTLREGQPAGASAQRCVPASAIQPHAPTCAGSRRRPPGLLQREGGSRRPGGPACVPWQPPASRAACVPISCAACWRAPYRELATAGREGQLVCRGNRRPGRPACVPISCTACWQAPYRERVAAAGREGRLVCRSHAPPVALRWQREPHPGGPGLETVPDGGSDQPSHPVEPTESLSAGVRREPRQQSCMGRGPPAQAGRGPPAELERGPPP